MPDRWRWSRGGDDLYPPAVQSLDELIRQTTDVLGDPVLPELQDEREAGGEPDGADVVAGASGLPRSGLTRETNSGTAASSGCRNDSPQVRAGGWAAKNPATGRLILARIFGER